MPVLDIQPSFGGRSSTRNFRDFATEHKHEYFALVSDPDVTDAEIYADLRLPQSGDTHPGDPNATLAKIDIAEDSRRQLVKRIKVLWDTDSSGLEGDNGTTLGNDPENPDPLTFAPEVTWDMGLYQEVAEKGRLYEFGVLPDEDDEGRFQFGLRLDENQTLICSSGGEVFERPPMRDDARTVCRIRRNEIVPPPVIGYYMNTVNEDEIVIDSVRIPPFCGKVCGVRIGKVQRRGAIKYRAVDYEVHARRDGWFTELLDRGYYEQVNGYDLTPAVSGWVTRQIIDQVTGQPVTKAALLNGEGEPLVPPRELNPVERDRWVRENAKFRSYMLYRTVPWSPLAFPPVT